MPHKKGICVKCNGETSTIKSLICKPCDLVRRKPLHTRQEYARNWTMLKKYNLDSEDFDTLWVTFRGKCGICFNKMKMPESKQGQALDVVAIDHDHKTGNIRGLLCNKCNKGVGFFDDNIDLLKSAIKWLEERT